MRKLIILLSFLLITIHVIGQQPYINNHNYGNGFTRTSVDSSEKIPVMSYPHMSTNLTGPGFEIYNITDSSLYIFTGTTWLKIISSGSVPIPTLQQVTDAGNTTTDNVTAKDIISYIPNADFHEPYFLGYDVENGDTTFEVTPNEFWYRDYNHLQTFSIDSENIRFSVKNTIDTSSFKLDTSGFTLIGNSKYNPVTIKKGVVQSGGGSIKYYNGVGFDCANCGYDINDGTGANYEYGRLGTDGTQAAILNLWDQNDALWNGGIATGRWFDNQYFVDTAVDSNQYLLYLGNGAFSVAALHMPKNGFSALLRDFTFPDKSGILALQSYVDSSGRFLGGQISSLPAIGQTINSSTVVGWLDSAFYATQIPTASLTGGTILEMNVVSTVLSETLAWTAGRQAHTNPLSTVVVAGNNETFSQPAAPGTVSGTQAVTITANTNQTFTMTVTTTDGKTATSSTTYTFEPKRYWGYCNTSSPTDAQVLAVLGGGSELTTTRAKSSFSIIISGANQNFYFAYPASFGNLTSFVVGGFESIGAFTLTTRNLTNVNGFTQSYNIYVSNNTFSNTTISGIVTQ